MLVTECLVAEDLSLREALKNVFPLHKKPDENSEQHICLCIVTLWTLGCAHALETDHEAP